MTIIQTLAGISGFLGLVAVLAYFYLIQQLKSSRESIRQAIEGEGLFNADQIIKILEQFKDDDKRLEALEKLTKLDAGKARNILLKIKDNVDIQRINELSQGHFQKITLYSAIFFILLAVLGLGYVLLNPPSEHPSTETPGEQQTVMYQTCRRPEFGIEDWTFNSGRITRSSDWVDGGKNPDWWCDQLINSTIQARNIGSEHEIVFRDPHPELEISEKDILGHVTYKYTCEIEINWEPIYVEKQDPVCGVLN